MTVVSLTIHATIKLQPGYTPDDLMDDVEHELRKFGGLDIISIGTSTPPITTEPSGVEAVTSTNPYE